MSYDYGTKQLEISNPFRLEGFIVAVRGLIMLILGIYLIFTVRSQLVTGSEVSAWIQIAGGLIILSFGIAALSAGLLRVFKFYVGRGVPSDLANSGNTHHAPLYSLGALKEMLYKRINPTFKEPSSWLARLLHTMFGKLLYLPLPIRSIAQALFESAALTILILSLYGLALFSGSTGLTSITNTSAGDWLGWIYVVGVLFVWWDRRPGRNILTTNHFIERPNKTLAIWIALSILAPFFLTLLAKHIGLPNIQISPYPWLATLLGLAVIVVGYGFAMTIIRFPKDDVRTDVSEYWNHLNGVIQPNDVFRSFDKTLADFRFLEIPNRVYERSEPELTSDNKGSFLGSMVQEVQPIPKEVNYSKIYNVGRLFGALGGQILMVVAALWFFILIKNNTSSTPLDYVNGTIGIIILSIFGLIMARIAYAQFAEIFFTSYLISVKLEGTYHVKGLDIGNSAPTFGASGAVESRMTPQVFASRVHSSTFSVTGARNLEQPRYILEMEKDDDFINAIISDVRQFVDLTQAGESAPINVTQNAADSNEALEAPLEGGVIEGQSTETEEKDSNE